MPGPGWTWVRGSADWVKGQPLSCCFLQRWLGTGDMQDDDQRYCDAKLLPLELLTLSLDHWCG